VNRTLVQNNRFTAEAFDYFLNHQMHSATVDEMIRWIGPLAPSKPQLVGVFNSGTIPMGELRDFLALVLLEHKYLGTVSSTSPYLFP